MSEPIRVVRQQTYEARWRDWAGATHIEVLSSPPVFKPAHVLFPLADGTYRAEKNEKVDGLRWKTIPQVVTGGDPGGIQS